MKAAGFHQKLIDFSADLPEATGASWLAH